MFQSELDGQSFELSAAEEKAGRLTSEVSRLTEELRQEQDKLAPLEKQKSSLELAVKDLQVNVILAA